MPRIPEVDGQDANAEQQAVLEADVESYGEVLNTTRIYAHAPELLPPLSALHGALTDGGVSTSLVALARLRTAQINGCPF
jgi:alkylhydroperoxidase family enzyme